MLIGVMADSHDNVPKLEAAVSLFKQRQVQHVLHAGDFVAPFAIEPLRGLDCPVLSVFGNNDGERLGLAARIREIGEVHAYLATATLDDRRIAVVHYPELAEPLAESGAYDLVVYGHTHRVDQTSGPRPATQSRRDRWLAHRLFDRRGGGFDHLPGPNPRAVRRARFLNVFEPLDARRVD